MVRLSPFLLAALLFALGLSSCSKHGDAPAPGQQQPQEKVPSPTVEFYDNATSTPLLQLIDGAQTTIQIEIYQMSDPDVLAALRRALGRGVVIGVVQEPKSLGSTCNLFADEVTTPSAGCADQRAFRQEVLARGGTYVPYRKETLCATTSIPCFLHGKMVIADSRAALVSTGNFNSSNLCNRSQNPSRCNRDYSVITRDPETVKFLAAVFAQDTLGERYDLAAQLTPSLSEKLTVSPLSRPPLVELIGSARSSIHVENQYLEDREMNEALMDAARRGVKVEITVASLCAFGPPSARDQAQAKELFGAFDAAGIETRLLPEQFKVGGRPGYLHAKAMVVDGARAWVGSVNGSASALANNREFGLFFSSQASVGELDALLTADHSSSAMETWSESLECKKD
jgi:phosphatidylserine/phosphatidylglycerophosphate/cardiolipin synthase-like enzyme